MSPRLVALGNIRAPKDYPTMIAAIALLRHRFPALRLQIAGNVESQELMDLLQRLVRDSGLEETIDFLGYVEDPRPLLESADCFLLSSTKEGFSLATIEAMLAGVPVVATRCGGPEEILRDYGTGRLVASGRPDLLAEAVADVLKRPCETALMVERARDHAVHAFGERSMVDAYELLYRQVLDERGAQRS